MHRSRLIQIGRTMNDSAAGAATLRPSGTGSEPDAHGQAALLLAESMLHMLVEKRTLTLVDALSVIQTTCEVKIDVAEAAGESNRRMQESLELLRMMSASFAVDKQ